MLFADKFWFILELTLRVLSKKINFIYITLITLTHFSFFPSKSKFYKCAELKLKVKIPKVKFAFRFFQTYLNSCRHCH